ncbi:MAG: HAD family phosphatase [Deltaproteobacteria bacterium]|nr:HAD family phosphatase [Deltaproteobacteria bacterium]
MIKALIFDLDGTLANTELLHYRAWKKTLFNNGVTRFSLDTFMTFVGTSNEKVAGDFIKSERIEKSVPQVVLEKQIVYLGLIPEIKLFPGAREIITRYHGTFRLALASSSHKKEIMTLLKSHNLDSYFDLIIGGDMVERKKPDPEIYLKVQQALGVASHESIAFEDSEHGLNSAKNAAMYGVAIPNEFTLDHDFSRADLILNSLADMDDDKIASLLHSPP